MHTFARCTPLIPALVLALAMPGNAQETQAQPRTHTVVRGDNLWDLSQTYLGNPFLWPEIYRLNRDVIEDPHWIYPGEVLRLPMDTTGRVPQVSQVPEQQTPVVEAPPEPEVAAPPMDPTSPTVFSRRPMVAQVGPTSTQGNVGVVGLEPAPTVRPGEVLAAPYVDREGGPRGFGRIIKSGDLSGVGEATERYRFQAYDRIFIAPPVGYVAPEGERYLAIRLGPVIEDQGQVVIPTGVVEVIKSPRADVAAVARVVKAFSEVSATDRLIPIDTAGAGSSIRPVRVADGPSTTIRWIYEEPVLPSVQNYIVLGVSSRNGVRMGDEFIIYKPQQRPDEEELADPEILIAKVQVVRSTPYGATAVILGQEQPPIKEGMHARITARMP